MAKKKQKKETIDLTTISPWRSDAARDLVIDTMFDSDPFKDFVKKEVLAHPDVNVHTVQELIALLDNLLQTNISSEESEANNDLVNQFAALTNYVDNAQASGLTYSKDNKPNPKALFWPDPTGELGEGSIYETLPVVENLGLVTKKTPIGSAGSCFAVEIARNLMDRKFNYVVKEKTCDPKTGTFIPGEDMDNPSIQYSCNWGILFNTPSFRQVAEKSFGVRDLPRVVLQVSEDPIIYTDPFRESVMFPSIESFEADYDNHIEASRSALSECEVFVITLGLNECWEFIPDGSVLSRNPRSRDIFGLLRHRTLTVQDNIDNIQAFIDIVRVHNPGLKLIISVSPVPFLATGRADKYHVVTANGHSKAVLRVAAQELAESNEGVYYFPSYEMVTTCIEKPWGPDQRHVSAEGVAGVMKLFDAMFVA